MFLGALGAASLATKPVVEMRSSSMRPSYCLDGCRCFLTEYGFSYCLRFVMGVGLGALLVTLFAGFTNICPVEIAERGPVGFPLLALVISALFIDCDGTHAAD